MDQLRSSALTKHNQQLLIAALLYITVFVISINLLAAKSSFIGIPAAFTYAAVNGILLGRAFFGEENFFLRLVLGMFLFTALLGLVSWLTMIAYDLSIFPTAIALAVVATCSIILQRKTRTIKLNSTPKTHLPLKSSWYVTVADILYLFTAILAFYLLFVSRKGEVYSIWVALDPAFIPVFFSSTFLLLVTVIFPQKIERKLLAIVVYSTLCLSFFVLVFPAGDVSGQQHIIGRTRLVYDNMAMHGIGIPTSGVLNQIYLWFRGDHLQSALTVILARMFYIDVYWTHMLLVPVLWGTFIPMGIFLITRLLSKDEIISIISPVLFLAFPYALSWGTISTYNSLGFLFFLYLVYFLLKYLNSNESKNQIMLILLLTLLAFMSHFLTGIISFSLLILALCVKRCELQGLKSKETASYFLVSFVFGVSLLPLALTYRRFFYPESTYFGLAKLSELSKEQIIWTFLIEQYVNFDITTAIMFGVGPVLGILGLLYYFYVWRQKSDSRMGAYAIFLFSSLLLVLVDYRILKLFMVNVPFTEERLWVFRDLLLAPFLSILVINGLALLYKILLKKGNQLFKATYMSVKSVVTYGSIVFLLSGWMTASIYYAYPHFGPLQTTSYEAEAVNLLKANSTKPYVVIADQWIIFAAEMFVGVYNPNEFYFSTTDPRGVRLYLQMRNDASAETMMEAMEYNNAEVAYFIVEKPRLGEEKFNSVISEALMNGLGVYKILSYQGEEKLYIFYYEK